MKDQIVDKQLICFPKPGPITMGVMWDVRLPQVGSDSQPQTVPVARLLY